MLPNRVTAIAAVMLALAQTLPVPPEPDFSGRWVLKSVSPATADAAQSMTVEQTIIRTNLHGKPIGPFYKDLIVTRELAPGSRTEAYAIGSVGGTVGGVTRPGGSTSSSYRSVRWQGRVLEIQNSRYTGPDMRTGEWDDRVEEWSFTENGLLQLAITTESARSARSTVVLLYQRK